MALDARGLEGRPLLGKMRDLQPHLLVNNRFGTWSDAPTRRRPSPSPRPAIWTTGTWAISGRPSTPMAWAASRREAAWPATWSSPGHGAGERWREADQILDLLCESASTGRNLLLGVAPDGEGRLPREFTERSGRIGRWLAVHGEAIYGTQGCEVARASVSAAKRASATPSTWSSAFWPEGGWLRLAGLANRVRKASLLGEGRRLEAVPDAWGITIRGLPKKSPRSSFPRHQIGTLWRTRGAALLARGLWNGDPERFLGWAEEKGEYGWAGACAAGEPEGK